tara:strand:+ start:20 stop:1000 length:981 start_codon:yes stop_codon:yes gene_type:complete
MPKENSLQKYTKCWVLTDGKTGMENQCIALADTLGLNPAIKRISVRTPWSFLPPQLWAMPLNALNDKSDQLDPPWPEILISTGRQTVALALAIKKINPSTFLIQIQNPTMALNKFDIVIAPKHDRLSAKNVVCTFGALHGVTSERLKSAYKEFTAEYNELPKPLIGVLIGGSNKTSRFTKEKVERFALMLREAVNSSGGSLAITPSRRTSENNLRVIKETLKDVQVNIWDGLGKNPYFGILAHADTFVVTGDSVNMVSEAIATKKPVHVYKNFGGSVKFDRFHNELETLGRTRPFTGQIESWEYKGIDDMKIAADAVKKAWDDYKN